MTRTRPSSIPAIFVALSGLLLVALPLSPFVYSAASKAISSPGYRLYTWASTSSPDLLAQLLSAVFCLAAVTFSLSLAWLVLTNQERGLLHINHPAMRNIEREKQLRQGDLYALIGMFVAASGVVGTCYLLAA